MRIEWLGKARKFQLNSSRRLAMRKEKPEGGLKGPPPQIGLSFFLPACFFADFWATKSHSLRSSGENCIKFEPKARDKKTFERKTLRNDVIPLPILGYFSMRAEGARKFSIFVEAVTSVGSRGVQICKS